MKTKPALLPDGRDSGYVFITDDAGRLIATVIKEKATLLAAADTMAAALEMIHDQNGKLSPEDWMILTNALAEANGDPIVVRHGNTYTVEPQNDDPLPF